MTGDGLSPLPTHLPCGDKTLFSGRSEVTGLMQRPSLWGPHHAVRASEDSGLVRSSGVKCGRAQAHHSAGGHGQPPTLQLRVQALLPPAGSHKFPGLWGWLNRRPWLAVSRGLPAGWTWPGSWAPLGCAGVVLSVRLPVLISQGGWPGARACCVELRPPGSV